MQAKIVHFSKVTYILTHVLSSAGTYSCQSTKINVFATLISHIQFLGFLHLSYNCLVMTKLQYGRKVT